MKGWKRPIIAEKGGVAKFVDLELGFTLREETDDATGISQRIVSDWRSAPKGNELKPAITLVDGKGNMVKLDNGNPAHYFMSVDAILSVDNGAEVICLSALLSTTRSEMRPVIEHFRDQDVKVVFGGAVITEEFADEINS